MCSFAEWLGSGLGPALGSGLSSVLSSEGRSSSRFGLDSPPGSLPPFVRVSSADLVSATASVSSGASLHDACFDHSQLYHGAHHVEVQ